MSEEISSSEEMLAIESQQLGPLQVPKSQVLNFPGGVFGFPAARGFCLVAVRPGSRFQLLQSVERKDLAFVVCNPQLIDPAYPLDLARELALPLLEPDEGIGVTCIVTVPPPPGAKTINMVAPLVVGATSHRGTQVILPANYDVRHPM